MPLRACLLIVGAIAVLASIAVLGTVSAVAPADEPTFTLRNGILEGWKVTRGDETLLCRDPVVFIRARQIECG